MELKSVYEERRSVNFFDPNQGVEDETLKNIVELAALAPSAFNLQPWELVVVKSKEAKERLHKLANNQPKILDAPVTLIVVGDKNGYDKSKSIWDKMLVAMGGNQAAIDGMQSASAFLYGTSEERKIKFAESNAGLLAMSLMYAAKEYGVDSHAMSGMDFDGVRNEFELGEDKTVVMLIVLGHLIHGKELYPRAYRKGYDEIAKEV